MARYKVQYITYPNCLVATEYSRSRAESGFYIGIFANFISLFAILNYISYSYRLFNAGSFLHVVDAFTGLLVAALLGLYFYVFRNRITDRECKIIIAKHQRSSIGDEVIDRLIEQIRKKSRSDMIEFTKRYFAYFIGGTVCSTGVIGAIVGIKKYLNNELYIEILLFSVLLICFGALCIWLISKKAT